MGEVQELAVNLVALEQEVGDACIQRQEMGALRRFGFLGIAAEADQPVAQQRSIRRKDRPPRQLLADRATEQAQGQINGGPLPGDVVLHVGVERLVAQIDLGGHAHQQHVQLER